MEYRIKAKKDLFNDGQCFTKDKVYTVETGRRLTTLASLMEVDTINDQGEKHTIGGWWREFELEKTYKARKDEEVETVKAFNVSEAQEWVNEKLDEPQKWEIEEQNY